MNFANSFTPGGGVLYGARAQEECLCRCSTLYHSLESDFLIKNFYERHCANGNDYANDDAIYSPSVKVFKSDTDFPKIIDEEKWFDVDVVTCAAPDLNDCPALDEEGLFKIHEQRLRRILDIAVLNGIEVLVLGAFGCGAFMNPPEIVASVAKKVLSDYEYAFKTVEFAVYCVPGKSENFEVFKEILSI